jgi:adenine phosphoribosyltransferase
MNLKSLIRDIPDFPQKGILFRDISPLLKSPEALKYVAEGFGKSVDMKTIDAFVGIESRGFILASFLASHFQKGFIPLRKAGKLPPPVITESYSLEYGKATLEMAPGTGSVMILDDVLATGGTLQAGINICQKAGYQVQQVGVLIDLTFLNQMKFQGKPVFSMVQY